MDLLLYFLILSIIYWPPPIEDGGIVSSLPPPTKMLLPFFHQIEFNSEASICLQQGNQISNQVLVTKNHFIVHVTDMRLM